MARNLAAWLQHLWELDVANSARSCADGSSLCSRTLFWSVGADELHWLHVSLAFSHRSGPPQLNHTTTGLTFFFLFACRYPHRLSFIPRIDHGSICPFSSPGIYGADLRPQSPPNLSEVRLMQVLKSRAMQWCTVALREGLGKAFVRHQSPSPSPKIWGARVSTCWKAAVQPFMEILVAPDVATWCNTSACGSWALGLLGSWALGLLANWRAENDQQNRKHPFAYTRCRIAMTTIYSAYPFGHLGMIPPTLIIPVTSRREVTIV